MHNAYIGRRFRQTKITRKASDAAENLHYIELFGSISTISLFYIFVESHNRKIKCTILSSQNISKYDYGRRTQHFKDR